MGCWDETCALTHLPIKDRDRVLGLYHQGSVPDTVFDMFMRIDAAILGHYDSCGRVEEGSEDRPTCMYRFDALVEFEIFKEEDFSPGRTFDKETTMLIVAILSTSDAQRSL